MKWIDDGSVLVGKTIKSVNLGDHWTTLLFSCEGGTQIIWISVGSCCSESYFWRPLDDLEGIVGQTVTAVDTVFGEPLTVCNERHQDCEHARRGRHDVLRAYAVNITTERAVYRVEFRNDSNGYYEGWIEEEEIRDEAH